MTSLLAETELTFDQPFPLVCAFIIGVLAVARVARLIVDDAFPPTVWLTEWYRHKVGQPWDKLVECPWCVSPYLAAIDIAWAWGSGLHWSWWLGNSIAAVSWLASWLSMRDIPEDMRE